MSNNLTMDLMQRIEELGTEKAALETALSKIMATCEQFGGRGALAHEVREVARQALLQQRGGRG